MNLKSFGAQTKDSLLKIEAKKKCCKHTYYRVCEALKENEYADLLREIYSNCKCDVCLRELLRGIFICCGSVTDPLKRYHLDFSFADDVSAKILCEALENAGFRPKSSLRKGKYIVYFKDSDTISDLLAYIGATSAAFEIMNGKIVKDVRNNANRLVNCDTANIEKAINASHKYIDAIEYIKSREALSALPSELREAAELRIELSQASLNELASKCQPPITKSGMKHRLEKILQYADELKNRDI